MSTDRRQTTGAPRRVQRRVNLLNTFTELIDGPLSISSVAEQIGVSRRAAESIVADLAELGWLTQVSPDNSFGRPAVRWAVNPRTVNVLGLDIGAHHCTAMVVNLRGELLGEVTHELAADMPATDRIEAATHAGNQATLDARLTRKDLTLCAVASPGVINDGAVKYFGGTGMPGWQGTNIAAEISARIGCTTIVAGDCALGALGESWLGAAQGHEDVLYVLSGERTGAAAIIDGRIHSGHLGGAGLIGELEAIQWKDIEAETFIRNNYAVHPGSRSKVFDQARSGEAPAIAAAAGFADALSLGSAAMVLALGPSHVVIGGKYSAFSDVFLERFIDNLMRWCPIMPEVSTSALGPRAIGLGAVRLGIDYLDEALKDIARSSEVFPSVEGFNEKFRATRP
ncbi:ROK family transcriptional regulator [Trueperella pecoris]|uniref:ROK family transcriptional regulator n=1 Tax=Trueperella pecoris TaxID=2733571 RepID=A0A7M1R170_9ACTO|nr:ROK family protein [Trueperella pecoris]QOR47893.1 ROK family transcriptional regulator [Trueperella pecoris]